MHSLHSLLLCDMQLMWVHVVPFLQACVCLWYLWQFLYRTTTICSSGSSLSSMHETYVSLTLATRCQTGICCGYFQLMRANKLETAVSKPAVLGCQFFAFYFLITTAFVQCPPLQLETYLCEVLMQQRVNAPTVLSSVAMVRQWPHNDVKHRSLW